MLFTWLQFNWGPLLNASKVVKCSNVWQDIAREHGQSRQKWLSFHTRYILYKFTTMLQFSKGHLLNCSRVKGALKAVDTIGNCQRLASTVGVSQRMHKITNLQKFELNRSSNLRDNNESKKKHSCHTKLCAFGWLISRPQVLNLRSPNLRSRNQIRGKLHLSRKLWRFRGSCFSQCFIPSNSPHNSLPSKFLS